MPEKENAKLKKLLAAAILRDISKKEGYRNKKVITGGPAGPLLPRRGKCLTPVFDPIIMRDDHRNCLAWLPARYPI